MLPDKRGFARAVLGGEESTNPVPVLWIRGGAAKGVRSREFRQDLSLLMASGTRRRQGPLSAERRPGARRERAPWPGAGMQDARSSWSPVPGGRTANFSQAKSSTPGRTRNGPGGGGFHRQITLVDFLAQPLVRHIEMANKLGAI